VAAVSLFFAQDVKAIAVIAITATSQELVAPFKINLFNFFFSFYCSLISFISLFFMFKQGYYRTVLIINEGI